MHYSIYMKFKNWQNQPVLVKVRMVITLRVVDHVLFLELGDGHMTGLAL